MRTYSEDLREWVVRSVEKGMTARAAARHWEVDHKSVLKWIEHKKQTGSMAAKRRGGYKRRILDTHEESLLDKFGKKPDRTLHEWQMELEKERGIRVCLMTLWNFFKRHGVSPKQKAMITQE